MQQTWPQMRRRAIAVLGGKCVRCGCEDSRVLQFDHVCGDGNERQKRRHFHTRNYRTTHEIKKRYLRGTLVEAYQLLCANCHIIKTLEAKEFNQFHRRSTRSNGRAEEPDLFTGG